MIKEIPDYGEVFHLDQFIEDCKHNTYIDYDGSGYYSDGKVMFTDEQVLPSDIVRGKINYSYKFVIWFNR